MKKIVAKWGMTHAVTLHQVVARGSSTGTWFGCASRTQTTSFFRALYTTVYIAVIAQVMGVVLGLVAALMRIVEDRAAALALGPLRAGSSAARRCSCRSSSSTTARTSSSASTLIPNSLNLGLFSLDGAVVAGILALGINEGAYMREIIRAGIDSIDKGQMEAAKSLGMRYGLAMRRIVLPQAARVIVPPLGNEFNNMLKTTSLVFTIGVYEMFADAEIGYSNSFLPAEYFLAVAFWYLVLTTVWSVHPGGDRAQARPRASAARSSSFRERVQAAWTSRAEPHGRGDDRRRHARGRTSTRASAGSRC